MSERTGSRTAQLEQSPTYKDNKDHLVNSNLRRTAYYKRLWLLLSMSTVYRNLVKSLQEHNYSPSSPSLYTYNTLGMDESDPLITHPMTGRGKFQE